MPASVVSPAFATTHWSVVLAAADGAAPGSDESLSALCQTYWFPLYAHVRRRGHDAESARDLTQGFFAELLAQRTFARADRNRGRFRTFLLAALDHFLHHAHRDALALKRGGGCLYSARVSDAAVIIEHLEWLAFCLTGGRRSLAAQTQSRLQRAF